MRDLKLRAGWRLRAGAGVVGDQPRIIWGCLCGVQVGLGARRGCEWAQAGSACRAGAGRAVSGVGRQRRGLPVLAEAGHSRAGLHFLHSMTWSCCCHL